MDESVKKKEDKEQIGESILTNTPTLTTDNEDKVVASRGK